MADKKITQLTNITGANLVDADEFVVVDISADETKAITLGELKEAFDSGSGFVRITGDTMTGALDVQSTITADGLAVDTDTLYVDSTNNRVGIGTTSPSSPLTINRSTDGDCIEFETGGIIVGKISTAAGRSLVFDADPVPGGGTATTMRFNVDATEAMRINSNGYAIISSTGNTRSLSLGSTTPRLTIEGTSSTAGRAGVAGVQNSNDTSGPVHYLAKSRGTVNNSNTIVQGGDYLGQLNWNGADGTQLVQAGNISMQVDGTPAVNDMPGRLVFMTTADGTNYPTERMRISQNGHIALGSGGGQYDSEKVRIDGDTATTSVALALNNPKNYGTGVGVGYVALDFTRARSSGDNNYQMARIMGYNDAESSSAYGSLTISTRNNGTLTEAMRIDSSQRVLIGLTSARTEFFDSGVAPILQVQDSGSNAAIAIIRTDTSADGPSLLFGRSHGTGYGIVNNGDRLGRIPFQGADGVDFEQSVSIDAYVDGTPGVQDMPGRLVFSTTADGANAATERMRITSAGRFILQTGSSATGTYSATSSFVVLDNSSSGAEGLLLTADNGNTWLNADGGYDLWLNWESYNNSSSNTDLNVGDGNRGSQILRVVGSTRDVDINDADLRFPTSGDGILFSGNSRTNALNDYERGNWTPTFAGASANPSVTYSSRKGSYTKIGNYVIAFWDMTASAMSGGSGQALISGLPFSAAVNSANMAGYSVLQFRANSAMPSTSNATDLLKGYIAGVVMYLEIDHSGSAGYATKGLAPMWTTGRSTGYVLYTTNS